MAGEKNSPVVRMRSSSFFSIQPVSVFVGQKKRCDGSIRLSDDPNRCLVAELVSRQQPIPTVIPFII
jgi:hypothetical protein